jgi:hypothetical protein
MKPGSRIRVICAKMNRAPAVPSPAGGMAAKKPQDDCRNFVELDQIAQQLTSKDRS